MQDYNNFKISNLKNCRIQEKKTFQKKYSQYIEPIYGNQSEFLKKIFDGKDRESIILYDRGKLVGLSIYKNYLNSEFFEYGIDDALEIKTFLIFSEKKMLTGFYAAFLFNYISKQALDLEAKNIFGTVSQKKQEHISFFAKFNFVIKQRFLNYKKRGIDEFLINNNNPLGLWEQTNTIIGKYEKK